MDWIKVTVKADPAAEEIVSNILIEAGAQGVEIESSELSQQAPVTWDLTDEAAEGNMEFSLSAYYPIDGGEEAIEKIQSRLEAVRNNPDGASYGDLSVDSAVVADTDWTTSWREFFHPVRAADFIVVKPTWVDFEAEPDQIVIEIDPGMAFGTGNHESTRLCLELLEKFVHPGETVVDVGCGSGVLALAAAKLGAGKVYALDNDPVAVEVTRENAVVNGVSDKVVAEQSDLLSALPEGFTADMIVCNIIADVLIRLAPMLPRVLRDNGMLLCSGTIASRVEDVLAALSAADMRIVSLRRDGEWAAIACKYKKAASSLFGVSFLR